MCQPCRDIRLAVKTIRDKYPSSPLLAIGWSLGANILTNYLGEEVGARVTGGTNKNTNTPPSTVVGRRLLMPLSACTCGCPQGAKTPLSAAASMCNPFDLVLCDRAFETGVAVCWHTERFAPCISAPLRSAPLPHCSHRVRLGGWKSRRRRS